MKRFALAAVLLLGPCSLHAQESPGVGVILGEPTGISAKFWLDKTEAIDAAAAWSFGNQDSLQLHANYLLHRYDAFFGIDPQYGKLPLYFGLGLRYKSGENGGDDRFGVRVPIGVTY